MNCTSGYCVTVKFTGKKGVVHVGRDCDDIEPDRKECPNPEKQCIDRGFKTERHQDCAGASCQTDNCNNYDPTSIVIVGLVT